MDDPGSCKRIKEKAELPTGNLLEILNGYPDVSRYPELLSSHEIDPELVGRLSPSHVSIGRVAVPVEPSKVLIVNWSNAVLPRFLLDNGHSVVCCGLAPGVAPVAEALGVQDPWSTASETLPGLSHLRFDTIFCGAMGDFSDSEIHAGHELLLKSLRHGGTVVYQCDNRVDSDAFLAPINERWESSGDLCVETFFAVPSPASPSLLIREEFVVGAQDAWRHIARQFTQLELSGPLGPDIGTDIWRIFEKHKDFPFENLGRFCLLYSSSRSPEPKVKFDLFHASIGNRREEFWTETVKTSDSWSIQRQRLPWGETGVSAISKRSEPLFGHVFVDEKYLPGQSVSEKLVVALKENDGGSAFIALLETYRQFLRTTLDNQTDKLLDLLTDNIVIRSDGVFEPIDQEWLTRSKEFDPDLAFLRGLFYFLIRNEPTLAQIPHCRRYGETWGKFIDSVLSEFDLPTNNLARRAEQFENSFQDYVRNQVSRLGWNTLFNYRIGEFQGLNVGLSILSDAPVRSIKQNIPVRTRAASAPVTLELSVGDCFFDPSRICIEPENVGGPVRFHSAGLSVIGGPEDIEVFHVAGHKKAMSLASQHQFSEHFRQEADGTTDLINLIEFSFPPAELDSPKPLAVILKVELSWPEFGLRIEDRYLHLDRVWRREVLLHDLNNKVSDLNNKLTEQTVIAKSATKELELLKSSKVWRVAEFIRAVIYRKLRRSRFAETSRKASIVQLQESLGKAPAERLPSLVEGIGGIPAIPKGKSQNGPLITIVMPAHNTPKVWLSDAVGSVKVQTYQNWQLVIIDDGSTLLETREFLDQLDDPRATVLPLTRSAGISGATAIGIDAAHGEYVAFMGHDDMLSPAALQDVVDIISRDQPDILYTDETAFSDLDEKNDLGYFGTPRFKPDFSPDLLLSHNYITHLLVVRKSLIDNVGGPNSEFDGAQDYEFLLRLTERTDKVAHVPKPLYHCRQSTRSTSLDTTAMPQAHSKAALALEQALSRRRVKGEVLTANAPQYFRVRRDITGCPLVSVIIPFRDEPRLLQRSISAVLERTNYSNIEILGVDNGSVDELTFDIKDRFETTSDQVSFHSYDRPFNFSELVNFGVSQAHGSHVVLMNNDIEVINGDWLSCLLEHSQRPEIGAVGGKLYYPDDTIQHAGIVVGIGGYAGHSHKHKPGGDRGYLNRLNIIQNVSAVTGALLMCKKSMFEEIGGFDAVNFGVACNDVDFCLRLIESGYRNLFTPYALAYHFESVSRGYEDTPEKKARFKREVDAFRARHAEILEKGDPYYNPNLRLDVEDFSIRPLDND